LTIDEVAERASAVAEWLLADVRFLTETADLDQAIIDRLRAEGVPLTRFTTGVPSLHPEVDSFSTLWTLADGLSFRQYRFDIDGDADFRQSPIYAAYALGRSTRCRLENAPDPDEYSLLATLRGQGYTDYFVLPLPFGDGSFKAMTFATDQPRGFEEVHIAFLEMLSHPLGAAIERAYLRHLAHMLMETYVGPYAGSRVLAGEIRRGSGEQIRAAVWFCDLKGFTDLTERLQAPAMLSLLNTYFDIVTSAIAQEGGEVLKFIGDAVLAVFRPTNGEPERAALVRMLDAAQAVQVRLAEENRARAEAGEPAIACGVALHFGDLYYGNVGGANRLDFTVIGPAVNLTSRIEGLTRDLERPVLVSSEFARRHGGAFETMGEFDLKGIAEPVEVLAPAG